MQYLLVLALFAADYEWRKFPDEPDQISLWRDGRQLGNYRVSSGEYFARWQSGGFDEKASEPPFPPPAWVKPKKCGCSKGCNCSAKKCGCSDSKRCNPDCKCVKVIGGAGSVEADGTVNYGVEWEEMPSKPQHVVNGQAVTKEQLFAAIGAPQLPNDAGWMCVTAIGPQAMLDQFAKDFASAPELADWKGKVKVKAYLPTHWAVAGLGFVAPAVYFQDAAGRVLWREDSYPGAAGIAQDLRRIDPNYDPNKDPGPNSPAPDSEPLAFSTGHLLAGLGAGVGGLGCMAFTLAAIGLLVYLLWRRAHAAGV